MHRRALILAGLAYPLVGRAQQSCGLPTPEDIEGPFYKPGAPLKASLVEANSTAEKLIVTGLVLSMSACRPLAGVKLDFWHANDKGEYDALGFRYRGIVETDAQGRYRLETNLPPPYMGRPRHIHVKTQTRGGPLLTTQLYFPGEARGADRSLIVKPGPAGPVRTVTYDFVL
ncbi:MAG TPA: intradiol ring-cleavage dioxygenase [Burkholderiales bacterium]|jgi:protocatechuate 3,4-dioxygenase beta subunit|nr:intradiol ring-cleavage dioxygenase [Burkholderiales bacterium]HEX2650267.1 intradiol ring-cleavage dioxygenase [Burkholderiales bacterium]HTM60997.1 intradiol ring-cleavage dioxygenase [Burkholderiales bacterium]